MQSDRIPRATTEVIIFTTNNLKIEGKLFKGPDIRLSDELNLPKHTFLPVENATITMLHTGEVLQQKMAIVNKNEIVCACPLE